MIDLDNIKWNLSTKYRRGISGESGAEDEANEREAQTTMIDEEHLERVAQREMRGRLKQQ